MLWRPHRCHLVPVRCVCILKHLSLTFQISLQTYFQSELHSQTRTEKPRSSAHLLPRAMSKSGTWPGAVAMESLSNMDSAESCDSVISMNSGYVSVAVNLVSVICPRHSSICCVTRSVDSVLPGQSEQTYKRERFCLWLENENEELKLVACVVMTSTWTFTDSM